MRDCKACPHYPVDCSTVKWCKLEVEQLEKENAELKVQNENKREEIKMLRNEHKQDMAIHNNYVNKVEELKEQIENYKLSENESKEIIAELKGKLKKEQNLNKVIKERLVEVNCDCNTEKKEKCVMFPEYCEGEKKTVVDLMALVSDGLSESLIKQKEEQIEQLSQRILEQQKTIGSLTDTIDEMKAHCKAVDEVNEKMKCCGNCKKVKYKSPMIENDCTWCTNLDKWKLLDD